MLRFLAIALVAASLVATAANAGAQAHIGVGATVVRSARVSVEVGRSIQVRFAGRGATDLAVRVESGLVAVPSSGIVQLPASETKDGYVVVTVLG